MIIRVKKKTHIIIVNFGYILNFGYLFLSKGGCE